MRKEKDVKQKQKYTLTRAEERAIAKENRRAMKHFEALKARKNVKESEYLTKMHDPNNIVEFDNLHTYFYTDAGVVKAVDGVSFDIPRGSTVCVVGESGCGKSVTSLSLMQLVQAPQGQITAGEIRYNAGDKAYNVAKMPTEAMRKIRGKDITMIFQEPMTSLNPIFTIGNQLDEVSALHLGFDKQQAKEKSIEMLDLVGIARAAEVYKCYPHELSGGMRQRVMIAMAPQAHHRRRADDRAGRHHSGADSRPAARGARQNQRQHYAHHARPRRRRGDGGLRRRDVRRPHHRKGDGAGDFPRPQASVHHRPDEKQARRREDRGAALQHSWAGAESD